MTDRNTSKIGSIALVLAVLVSAVGVAFSGGVAAQSETLIVDSTFSASETTESAYVDVKGVDAMNGSGPVAVNVTFTGLNGTQDVANGTEIKTEQLTVAEGNISSTNYTLTESDVSEFDEISVQVGSSNTTLIEYVDWGTLEKTAGGGGALLGGAGGLSLPVIGVVLVGGYLLLGRDD